MKSFRKEIWITTRVKHDIVDITRDVEKALSESGIKEGLLLCNALHLTSSVFVNGMHSGLDEDFLEWLENQAPELPHDRYKHNGFETNADGHLKRSIMGRETVVAVTEGKLDLGPSERVLYGEFDGARSKKVLIKIIGE